MAGEGLRGADGGPSGSWPGTWVALPLGGLAGWQGLWGAAVGPGRRGSRPPQAAAVGMGSFGPRSGGGICVVVGGAGDLGITGEAPSSGLAGAGAGGLGQPWAEPLGADSLRGSGAPGAGRPGVVRPGAAPWASGVCFPSPSLSSRPLLSSGPSAGPEVRASESLRAERRECAGGPAARQPLGGDTHLATPALAARTTGLK